MIRALKRGDQIGSLTLVRKVPMLQGHYARMWVCLCKCGATTEKNQISLRNKKLYHRCDECHAASQRAHRKLLLLDANYQTEEPEVSP